MRPLIAFTLAAVAMAILVWWPSSRPVLLPTQIHGAWLAPVGSAPLDSPGGIAALARLQAMGVDTVAAGPEIIMPDIGRPEMTYGSDVEATRRFMREARQLGMGVFLLPRIESPEFFQPPYPWRADIKMKDPADWPRFFANFREAVTFFAKLGHEEGARVLGLGLEYRAAVKEFPDEWRRVAREAKAAFGGPVTYSANWDDYDQITWWDAVDWIGVGAYFELLDDGLPKDTFDESKPLPEGTLGGLIDGWKPIKADLREFSRRFSRPIFFTEVGYTPFADCGYYPWRWQPKIEVPKAEEFGPPIPGVTPASRPAEPPRQVRPIDARQQALCYRAIFRVFAGEPWWQGLCVWRFYTDPSAVPEWDYSPQGREAEAVLKDAYQRR